ncbi:MAG: indolepyruvate oxidoreductase subunit beta [Flavobacteriaceae bacterium]|nr:indolepyruvate oxidoreductase subunit beta [Flavobacteriaceae bacterium]
MNSNIILSGVGGQGILTIAAVIDTAALSENLNIKQSEVHGMSQRGGAVLSHVRISDKEIFSDLIPQGSADMILSVEPMELLRHLSYLKKDGWLITDSKTFENILDYPKKDNLYKQIMSHPNHIIIKATDVAKELGNSKVANMILLGAASSLIPLTEISLQNAIKSLFKNKSEKIIQLNLEAFNTGKDLAKSYSEFVFCD